MTWVIDSTHRFEKMCVHLTFASPPCEHLLKMFHEHYKHPFKIFREHEKHPLKMFYKHDKHPLKMIH